MENRLYYMKDGEPFAGHWVEKDGLFKWEETKVSSKYYQEHIQDFHTKPWWEVLELKVENEK